MDQKYSFCADIYNKIYIYIFECFKDKSENNFIHKFNSQNM